MSSFPYAMQQTMRWYGPNDPVSLSDIRQSGCTGVVSALHEIPNGEVWPVSAIQERKSIIEKAGMSWTVVESLPVHESIKTHQLGFEQYIENYKASLRHLAECGVSIVTYNFMPLLDWTRTNLNYELDDGSKALKYELDAVACYDLYILQRPNAKLSYSDEIIEKASNRFKKMSDNDKWELERTIIAGLPGSEESYSSNDFLQAINSYRNIDEARLKNNLYDFLSTVCPVADEVNLKLVIHPDDPPYSMFGLPRVVSTANDLRALFKCVPNTSNNLCFCVGSFSIREDNMIAKMINEFGERIYFTHLRNTQRSGNGDFFESSHLKGSVDMYDVVRALTVTAMKYKRCIAMRPDHGHQMLDDLRKSTNPGYSAIGRLKGLAEIRGLEFGIIRSMED